MPRDSDEQLKLREACMLSPDLFKDWEKLHTSIATVSLFACALHNDNEVEPRAVPAQHHNNVDKTNEQDGWDKLNGQANINGMEDFLKALWDKARNANNILAKLKSIIVEGKH